VTRLKDILKMSYVPILNFVLSGKLTFRSLSLTSWHEKAEMFAFLSSYNKLIMQFYLLIQLSMRSMFKYSFSAYYENNLSVTY